MLPLKLTFINLLFEWRLFSAKNLTGSFKGRQCNKTAQASRFVLGSLFDQLAFLLRVIREHLRPQRILGRAPRRDCGVSLGHCKTMVALQGNGSTAAL
jgi:hypothetical protein